MTEKRKTMHYALEVLSLLCEWEDCSKVSTEIEDFISHIINEHIVNLYGDDLHCHWKDCEGFTENLPELRRHILLHAFHTKIKCHGRNLQKRRKIEDCTLSAHSRNIIPELPEPLICCWDNCSHEFECPERFYRHVDYHCESYDREESGGFVACAWHGCQRNFADAHKLREHLRSHTQEKLIACPTCGGMFASRTKFFDHIQRQLPVDESDPDNTFVCEYCSRKMNSERLLRDHMRHHGETLKKECMILRNDLNKRKMRGKRKREQGVMKNLPRRHEKPIKSEKSFKVLERIEPPNVKQEKNEHNMDEQQNTLYTNEEIKENKNVIRYIEMNSNSDELDLFFKSMCESTRKMPVLYQIKLKRQILDAVLSTEEGLSMDTASTTSNPDSPCSFCSRRAYS